MSNGFRLFRSTSTGKTGWYPDFFATWPNFEEVDPLTETCVDCGLKENDDPMTEEDN